MEETVKLPLTNENGYYEIRLESIGGLGANLCGKMLGELGLKYLGLNSSSFSSYGSEKTGTPVKGFVRYSPKDTDIRVHSAIRNPNILAVFHDALLADSSVLAGCDANTVIIINTNNENILGTGNYKKLYFIDAEKIAIESKSRINVVMLGAMARVMGFIKLEFLEDICTDTLGKKYPAALQGNLEGIRRGYNEIKKYTEDSPVWGYDTAPIGGINPNFGNSVVNDLSPSRQGYFPVFIPERCINCGLCDTTCPDMVFQFQKGEYKGREMMVNKGLDYYHCKGCLRCVDVCPVQALVKGEETADTDKKYFIPNQELRRNPKYYMKAGPDGYITSESFLTEKRVEV